MLKSSEQRGSRRWTRLLFTGVVLLAAMGVRELGALAVGPGAGENEAGLPLARLQTISSISDRQMTSIVIEASDPVPYLTTHPEPLTLLVDLRNVSIEGVVNRVTSPRGTIAGVTVETTESLGAPVARIRVTLAREARFRIVSNRNVIRVDVENPEAAAAASPVVMKTSIASPSSSSASSPNASRATRRAAALRPATRLTAVRAIRRESAVRITLTGNGLVEPASGERAKDLPHRFVLDFKGVASIVPKVTPVGLGPVQQIRVATHSSRPLVTRLVVDLERWVDPRVERGLDGGALAIVFDESPATSGPVNVVDAQAALKLPISEDPPKPADPVNGQPAPGAPAPPVPPEPAVTPEVLPIAGPAPAAASQTPAAAPASVPPSTSTQPPAALSQPASAPVQPPAAPQPPASPPQAPQQPPPVVQPATPAPGVPAGAPPQERQYTGFPISLDFENADLQAVLRVFAQETGLNVVIDPTVQGTVNVQLREVPWDQALDIILRANKLGWTLEGTIVRIAPLGVLADEEAAKAKLATAQAEAGALQTITRILSYAKASEFSALLKSGGLGVLSQRGSVLVDERTNTLIVTDLPERVRGITDLIDTLDRPQPQVEIEARIVQTNRNFEKAIGVQWGLNGRMAPELGNTSPLAFPNQGSITAGTNLPVSAAPSAVSLALGSVNGAINIDAALSALERSGQGRLLSAPRVTTQNNVAAEMTQGVEIPIQTVANNTVTVTFRPAALTLKVTPQITAAGTVIMRVELENAAPDFSKQINGIPPIDTQKAITSVLVRDGETTVIGGIYLSREQAQRDLTPGLGRVPILKWLFSRESNTEENRELLVFITPRIAKPPDAAPTGLQ